MRRPVLALVLFVSLALCAAPRRALAGGHVADVVIDGKLLDGRVQLARVLGLTKDAAYDDLAALTQRVDDALTNLGYLKLEEAWVESLEGLRVHLRVEPAVVVRHIFVHGNWPVFDEEIKRRLILRPGSRLPAASDREALVAREEEHVRDYLRRDGYFKAEVRITLKTAGRPYWLDLNVQVTRGPWFHLTEVIAEGAIVLRPRDLLGFFGSNLPSWLGRFRPEKLRDDAHDAEAAYRNRGYPSARVVTDFDPERDLIANTDTARLHVRVMEKSRVDVRFEGNHAIADKDLRERLTVFTSGSYDEVELAQSARELIRLYQSNGFLEAVVSFRRKRQNSVEDITFMVDEGPELKVRAVGFLSEPGAPSLDDAERVGLPGVVTTRPFPRIGEIGLGAGGFVTPVQVVQDSERILAWERARGFPNARVHAEIVREPDAFAKVGVLAADVATDFGITGDLYVRFYIDKGTSQTIDTVSVGFHGPHGRAVEDLAAIVSLLPGSPFSVDAVQAARKRLVDSYAARGHPYAEVAAPSLVWDAEHTRVRIGLVVDEGPVVRFGEIIVRGNFRTRPWVIYRNLPFHAGDLFDVTKIAIAERNLQTHAIFNGVRVVPFGITRRVNPVPILVEIQQERYDDWGGILLSAGYSTDVGLTIQPSYYWGNVMGGGGSAELRLEAALDVTQYAAWPWEYSAPFYRRLAASLRYVHPHLYLPSLRGEITTFARKENTVRLGEIDSAGASLSISWLASPSFRLFGRYEWTLSSLQSIPFQRQPGRNDSVGAASDTTRTGKLTFGLVFDDRKSFDGAKNPLMPIDGWLLAGSAGVASAAFGGSDNFVVLSGQLQRYQPLGAGFSFILNLRGDYGLPLDGVPQLPAVDRFFAGGDVATRGFATDTLLWEQVTSTVNSSSQAAAFRYAPRGGNIRGLGTVELQFPITKIAGFPVDGAVFSDVGTLFDAPSSFQWRNVKVSVGVSVFRMLTPIGPISFEYAYPLTQSIVEQGWRSQPWFRHWPGLIHFNWGIPILR